MRFGVAAVKNNKIKNQKEKRMNSLHKSKIQNYTAMLWMTVIILVTAFTPAMAADPTGAAPTPTVPAYLVKSMYNSSGTYADLPGIGWYAGWSSATGLGDFSIPPTVKKYAGLQYAGVEFYSPLIDVHNMTTMHVDVWTPDANQLGIKLVSTVGGEYQLNLDNTKITGVNTWISLNIPLGQFAAGNPAMDLSKLMQLLWVDNGGVGGGVTGGKFFFDNVYFYNTNSILPAPTPTLNQSKVISLHNSSNTYTNVPVTFWWDNWGQAATYTEYSIKGLATNVVKKYSNLDYTGVQFPAINASGMNGLHVDLWTPNANQFGIKLVSGGGANAYTVKFNSSVVSSNGWVSLDIPLSQYTANGINPASIFQILWLDNGEAGSQIQNGNFYIDNVYFFTNTIAAPPIMAPTNAAPNPTQAAASVISMYNSSHIYTDRTIDTWIAGWSGAIGSTYNIVHGGVTNTVKKYASLNYAGVEFYSPNSINASAGVNTMHLDVWTPDATKFAIKLVSHSPGAAEHLVQFSSSTITNRGWIRLDIPLSQFTGVDLANLDQILWVDNADAGDGGTEFGTFFIDNVYFWSNNIALPPVTHPTVAAPTPTRLPGNVISMYNSSGTYSDRPIDSWLAGWSGAAESDYTIPTTTSVVKKYSSLSYAGVEFYGGNSIDVSGMDALHVDIWTPDADQFGIQLVSVTGGTQAAQANRTSLAAYGWVSLDIPLSEFASANPSTLLTDLQQMLLLDNPSVGGGVINGLFYIDNVYFYKSAIPGNGDKLVIVTNGVGTLKAVAAGTSGTPTNEAALLIGYNKFTITATPESNYLFSNWVVQGDSPYTTTSAKLVFTMESNLVLIANFVTNRFFDVAGTFNGLITNATPSHDNAGFITMKVTPMAGKTTGFSGKLLLDGNSVSFGGTFNLDGTGVLKKGLPVSRVTFSKPDLGMTLQLHFNGSDTMSGSLSNYNGSWVSHFEMDRAVWTTNNPATNYSGLFTLVLPGTNNVAKGPAGDGYATVSIDTNGVIKMTGKLGDGTAIKQKTTVSKNGDWPLFSAGFNDPLTKEYQGSIMGWVGVGPNPTRSLDGTLQLIKEINSNFVASYPGGYTNGALAIVASAYDIPTAGNFAIPLAASGTNVTGSVTLSGGGLLSDLISTLILTAAPGNKTAVTVSAGGLKFGVKPKSGQLSGTFIHPGSLISTKVEGVILNEQNEGRGFFQGSGTTSGTMHLQ